MVKNFSPYFFEFLNLKFFLNILLILIVDESETLFNIWKSIIENELREINYMASEASLDFSLSFNNSGIYIKIQGFNDSISSVLDVLLLKFKSITTEDKESKLLTQIEKYAKQYKNFYLHSSTLKLIPT